MIRYIFIQQMIKPAGRFLTIFALLVASCFPKLSAQEYVGGLLLDNTVFSPALNPYIVVEPVIVPEGVTLTIEPGTIMRFMISSSIKTEGGTLIARGNATSPIVMMAQTDKKWDGINFSGSKTMFDVEGNYLSGSILEHISMNMTTTALVLSDTALILAQHLSITNGDYGVYLQSGSTLHLYNSTIDQCSYGMYIKNSGSNIIDNCSVTNCEIGIFFPSNNSSRYNRFTNNNLSYHRSIALFLSIGQSNIQHNLIQGNTVTYNNIGLHIGNGGSNDQGFNVVSSNIVQHNDIGIKLSQDSDTLKANLVEMNVTGVLLTKASNNKLINNIIQDNSDWGLTLTDGSSVNYISTNSFYNNNKGIRVTHKDFKYSTNNTFILNLLHNNLNETFLFEAGPQQPLSFNSIISPRNSEAFVNHFDVNILAQNNWWGTTDTTRIDSLIYDFHDQDIFGEVIYKPMLDFPDPQSPISKPRMVVKRLAGERIMVDWLNNTEPDLAGYKVYFGNAGEGGFIGFVDVGADTTYVFDNLSLADPVAVTAYDNDADGYSDQPEGHESAYSYAIAGPYAGDDASVCQDDNFILNTATSLNDQDLLWTTSGDGSFTNPAQLNATYIPGQADILTGNVILTLSQSFQNMVLTDKMELHISGMPFLFAGNDTMVNQYDAFHTNTSIASNYTAINWITRGDGIFANPGELNTHYQPGSNDIISGAVQLILNLQSDCGNLSDTMLLIIIPSFNINGKVRRGDAIVPDGLVVAIRTGTGGVKAVSTSNTQPDGTFNFINLPIGDYYLYALNDPQNNTLWMPSYYAEARKWQNAYRLPLNTDVFDIDISLLPLSNQLPAGTGSISGFFNYVGKSAGDDSIYNKPWFPGNFYQFEENPGIPAANHVVLLMNTDLNRVFAWALTQADGSFHFNSLPFGNYRLWGEKAGYVNNLSTIITISPANSDIEGVQLMITQKSIELSLPVDEMPVISDFIIYPNPARDMVWINPALLASGEPAELCFYTTDGKLVLRRKTDPDLLSQGGSVNISELESGLYLVTLSSGNQPQKSMKLSVIR